MSKPIKVNTATLKAEVEAWVQKWQPRLHIPEWHLIVQVVEPDTLWTSKHQAAAQIDWQSEYLNATIKVAPEARAFPEELYHPLEYCVLHELCHLLSAHLVDAVDDAVVALVGAPRKTAAEQVRRGEEELTERIARLVWKAYQEEEPTGV